MAKAYPVEPKYAATNRDCHLAKSATDVFDMLMITYANGDLCSHLLYNACNQNYLERCASYYSYLTLDRSENIPNYPKKDSEWMRAYPPSGDTIRSMYDDAANSIWNRW